jgi:hypothetical protein
VISRGLDQTRQKLQRGSRQTKGARY